MSWTDKEERQLEGLLKDVLKNKKTNDDIVAHFQRGGRSEKAIRTKIRVMQAEVIIGHVAGAVDAGNGSRWSADEVAAFTKEVAKYDSAELMANSDLKNNKNWVTLIRALRRKTKIKRSFQSVKTQLMKIIQEEEEQEAAARKARAKTKKATTKSKKKEEDDDAPPAKRLRGGDTRPTTTKQEKRQDSSSSRPAVNRKAKKKSSSAAADSSPPKVVTRWWTEEEKKELERMLKNGKDVEEIIAHFARHGRSQSAMRTRIALAEFEIAVGHIAGVSSASHSSPQWNDMEKTVFVEELTKFGVEEEPSYDDWVQISRAIRRRTKVKRTLEAYQRQLRILRQETRASAAAESRAKRELAEAKGGGGNKRKRGSDKPVASSSHSQDDQSDDDDVDDDSSDEEGEDLSSPGSDAAPSGKSTKKSRAAAPKQALVGKTSGPAHWTKREVDDLEAMMRKGIDTTAIIAHFARSGRTESAVRSKISKAQVELAVGFIPGLQEPPRGNKQWEDMELLIFSQELAKYDINDLSTGEWVKIMRVLREKTKIKRSFPACKAQLLKMPEFTEGSQSGSQNDEAQRASVSPQRQSGIAPGYNGKASQMRVKSDPPTSKSTSLSVIAQVGLYQIFKIEIMGRGRLQLGLELRDIEWMGQELRRSFPGSSSYTQVVSVRPASLGERAGVLPKDVICWHTGGSAPVASRDDLLCGDDEESSSPWQLLSVAAFNDRVKAASAGKSFAFYVARKIRKKKINKSAVPNDSLNGVVLSEEMASKVNTFSSLSDHEKDALLEEVKNDAKMNFEADRDSVIASLPQSVSQEFGQIGFAKWGNRKDYYPVLVVSPFDVSPTSDARALWFQKYTAHKEKKKLAKMVHLVYWYGEPESSNRCLILIPHDDFVPWLVGESKNYHKLSPYIQKKQSREQYSLSFYEQCQVRAHAEMNADLKKTPEERLKSRIPRSQELYETLCADDLAEFSSGPSQRKSNYWTAQEEKDLKAMLADGMDINEIVSHFIGGGRSDSAVRTKICRAQFEDSVGFVPGAIEPANPSQKWSGKEVSVFTKLLAKFDDLGNISLDDWTKIMRKLRKQTKLKRSYMSCKRQLGRMRAAGFVAGNIWGDEEDDDSLAKGGSHGDGYSSSQSIGDDASDEDDSELRKTRITTMPATRKVSTAAYAYSSSSVDDMSAASTPSSTQKKEDQAMEHQHLFANFHTAESPHGVQEDLSSESYPDDATSKALAAFVKFNDRSKNLFLLNTALRSENAKLKIHLNSWLSKHEELAAVAKSVLKVTCEEPMRDRTLAAFGDKWSGETSLPNIGDGSRYFAEMLAYSKQIDSQNSELERENDMLKVEINYWKTKHGELKTRMEKAKASTGSMASTLKISPSIEAQSVPEDAPKPSKSSLKRKSSSMLPALPYGLSEGVDAGSKNNGAAYQIPEDAMPTENEQSVSATLLKLAAAPSKVFTGLTSFFGENKKESESCQPRKKQATTDLRSSPAGTAPAPADKTKPQSAMADNTEKHTQN